MLQYTNQVTDVFWLATVEKHRLEVIYDLPYVFQFTCMKERLVITVQDEYQRSQQLMHTLRLHHQQQHQTLFRLSFSCGPTGAQN